MILPEGGQNKERYWGDSAYLTGLAPRLIRRDSLELRWMRSPDRRFSSSLRRHRFLRRQLQLYGPGL